jgi:hypothetical protein
LRPFFWDVDPDHFDALSYPAYTIARLLEVGDEKAIAWLKQSFSVAQIVGVLRTERRLTRKSANFWALIYHLPVEEVAALKVAT